MIIGISAEAQKAIIKPVSFLGSSFYPYLDICTASGATFDRTRKVNVMPLRELPTLVTALQKGGFQPKIDKSVADSLREQASEHHSRVATAREVSSALSGLSLYPFQADGAGWLRTRKRALLGDEMGTGKTVQALCAIPSEVKTQPDQPVTAGGNWVVDGVEVVSRKPRVLVICPAVVKLNWKNETKRWRNDLIPVVLSGSKSFRWPMPGEVVIVNYDILPPIETISPATTPRGLFLIADEIHYVKTMKTGRGAKFHEMAKCVRDQNGTTWGLSGTPLVNRWEELYTVLRQLGLEKESFGTKKAAERMFYYHPKSVPNVLRSVMLRRTREEVLPDLPQKTYSEIMVEDIDTETRKSLDETMALMKAAGSFEGEKIKNDWQSNREVAAAMTRSRRLLATSKIPALKTLVEQYEEVEEPVLVFSAHRAPIDEIGQRPGWATITGDVTGDKRQETVERFQRGELKGLGITITAGGIGITLTRAHTAIFVDLDWTPAGNAQAEDRMARIGQLNPVLIVRMVADHPLDRRVFQLLSEKQMLITSSVGASEVKANSAMQHDLQAAMMLERLATVIEKSADVPVPEDAAPARTPRRGAESVEEKWAEVAIQTLARLDPDRAGVLNKMGFNRLDGVFGHKMAEVVAAGGGLTENQWAATVRLCMRYPRQVGRPVVEQEGAVAE